MTEHDAIHTRLDYMEQRFDEKLGQMADSITSMAKSIEKISDRTADQTLILERLNQHGSQINALDMRFDKVEQKIPVYDLYTGWIKYIGYAVSVAIILAIVGTVVSI